MTNTNAGRIAADGVRYRAAVSAYLAPGIRYAVVDFPYHSNVGDSAIWLGQAKALEAVGGAPPGYICTQSDCDFDALKRAIGPDGVVFICGGGNFGDLWTGNQLFREQLAQRLPQYRIVQLPQSLHFEQRDALDRAREVFRSHPDFHLMVRDESSLRIAREGLGLDAQLVPDGAFNIGSIPRKPATSRFSYLLRTDKEVAGGSSGEGKTETDWVLDEAAAGWNAVPRTWLQRLRDLRLSKERRRSDYFNGFAAVQVARGVEFLSRGEIAITDRLHGHILCLLSGIPHVIMDNSYGKVSGYIAAFTKDYEDYRAVADIAAARATAAEMLADRISALSDTPGAEVDA